MYTQIKAPTAFSRLIQKIHGAKRGFDASGIRRQPAVLAMLPIFGLMICLAGCAPSPDPLSAIPVTGREGKFEVHEYALIEQSKDNPTSLEFQQRVPAAVAAQRDGWRLSQAGDMRQAANQELAPFGFSLEANTAPPFSSYTLTRYGEPVKKGIASFWPVSIQAAGSSNENTDFLLPFVTLDGEKLVAKTTGVYPWPAQANQNTSPEFFGDKVAYAETALSSPVLLNAPAGNESDNGVDALVGRSLHTWNEDTTRHWALEGGGQLVLDGLALNKARDYEEAFGFSVVNGEPLYLFLKDGLTRISYNGKTQPFVYDQVVHNQVGELQVFNPGSDGNVIWFYALRDGLWYYVEAGIFK